MIETDLFDNFKNAMPGDFLTEDVDLKNNYPEYSTIKLYLRADPHDAETNPLSPEVAERETIESMTDFLSKLTLNVYKDGSLIYSASPDQPATLSDYLYLGEFKNGELTTLHLELSVPTSLGSEYAHRAGEVDWVLLTEDSSAEASTETSTEATSPDTGLLTSTPSFLTPSLLILLPLLAIGIIVFQRRGTRDRE